MVSIIPGNARTANDLLGQQVAQSLQQNVQPAIAQGLQRQRGHAAIDRLQQDLASANGDISKILPAIARAYTENPNLERSGIAQYALQNAKAANIYGDQPPQGNQPQSTGQGQPVPGMQSNRPTEVPPLIPGANNVPSGQARPTGYNVKTPAEMDAKAKQDAMATGNPAQYQQSMNEQQTLNKVSEDYKAGLENLALGNNISRTELPDFMEVGEQFDTRNPNQWLKNTKAAYAPIKNSLDRLEKSFSPGLGSALIGKDRDQALKRLTPDVQDLIKMGRKDQVEKYLASQWLSPTEIAEQEFPLQKKQEANLSKIPKGIFPPDKPLKWTDVGNVFKGQMHEKYTNPFVDYDTAVKNAPKEMQHMQDRLSKFFIDNIDENTSPLVLRDKLYEKNYDWRQINAGLRQAQEQGLKLNPAQQSELTDIAQPPIQSLPNIFEDWWRAIQFMRGAK